MSNQPADHHNRKRYQGFVAALVDAERVADDLLDALLNSATLFPDTDQVEFLARRTRQLVAAARLEAERETR